MNELRLIHEERNSFSIGLVYSIEDYDDQKREKRKKVHFII
ncbi:hypothetical protein A5888_003777 [Enterococcus sp. 9E7_DIV0242]|uniref:Uncharacterized protein n=1 Tax=Candidatus Enterococcus clewellii TaxID=1834193 RepID=A0A242K5V0_9ENTE|nr:hypothetical protein A5888_001905 [Enterococcus sp. 9E7_DIV0242]